MKHESNKTLQEIFNVETLEPQEISIEVLRDKYAKNEEKTIPEVRLRVAGALAALEKDPGFWREEFYRNQESGFIPAGRINSAAGMDIKATLINCFVQPVGDCIEGYDKDGYPSIYTALAEAASTMRRGGGVGYDFSKIRPLGAGVKGTQSHASGPLSYMRVYDRSCETVESAGARRGAQMGVLRCDHPDIVSFIKAKDVKGEFTNFNLSVGVTDAFIKAVEANDNWELVHKAAPNEDYASKNNSFFDKNRNLWVWKTIPSSELWELIMRSTYDHAEPGILFIDKMNQENNLWYCENIEATNPCAEQPLPPYGCCDLGSINLTKFVRNPFSRTVAPWFDYEAFEKAIKTSVRMLDNVLDATIWPLEKQYKEAMDKRRIGLGFLGIGDAILMLGLNYHKEDGVEFAKKVSEVLRDVAYNASIDLAIEKGKFPLFNARKYLQGGFVSRLPESIKKRIRKHGIRNSHLLSIAPTGTITLAFADNASNGIEPPFSWVYDRKKRQDDGTMKSFEVADHAWRVYRAMGHDVSKLPSNFVTALDMDVDAHINIMKAVQPYIDTSISKTVNIPSDYPYEDFKDLYIKAWKAGLKGLATYRPNNVMDAILSVKETPKSEVSTVAPVITEDKKDTDNGKTLEEIVREMYSESFESREDGKLPGFTIKGRFHTQEGEQKFLVIINILTIERNTRFGKVIIRRPVEFVLKANFAIRSPAWEATMRLMSLSARSGVPLPKIVENVRENAWNNGAVRFGTRLKDGRQIPLWHDSDIAALGYAIEEGLKDEGFLTDEGKLATNFILEKSDSDIQDNSQHKPKTSLDVIKGDAGKVIDNEKKPMAGSKCPECGANAVVKRDGCKICDNCGALGSCG